MALPQWNFKASNVVAPDLTGAAKLLASPGNIISDMMDKRDAKERQAIADQRAATLFDRQTDMYNRKIAGEQALVDYAKNPFQTSRALDMQRGAADQALINAANDNNLKYERSLKDLGITQDQVNAGTVSKDVMSKLYNPAFTEDTAVKVSNVYDNTSPFREDVENTIKRDLISKGVDPVTAQAYAKNEGSSYGTLKEYQAELDAQRKADITANKEANDYAWKVADFMRKVKKDNKSSSSSSSSSGTSLEKGIAGIGNDKTVAKLYDKAKAQNVDMKEFGRLFAVAGGFSPDDVAGWDITDFGKKDIDTTKLEELIAEKTTANQKLKVQGITPGSTTTTGVPKLSSVTTAPKSARQEASDSMARSMNRALSDVFKPTPKATEPEKSTTTTPTPTSTNDGISENVIQEDTNPVVEDTKKSKLDGELSIENLNKLEAGSKERSDKVRERNRLLQGKRDSKNFHGINLGQRYDKRPFLESFGESWLGKKLGVTDDKNPEKVSTTTRSEVRNRNKTNASKLPITTSAITTSILDPDKATAEEKSSTKALLKEVNVSKSEAKEFTRDWEYMAPEEQKSYGSLEDYIKHRKEIKNYNLNSSLPPVKLVNRLDS